jgi:pimeloyl-ACP methyl ester carboxylesterase
MRFNRFSGTYGAAMYANKYPENVGRFVLDAVLPGGIVSLTYCEYWQTSQLIIFRMRIEQSGT